MAWFTITSILFYSWFCFFIQKSILSQNWKINACFMTYLLFFLKNSPEYFIQASILVALESGSLGAWVQNACGQLKRRFSFKFMRNGVSCKELYFLLAPWAVSAPTSRPPACQTLQQHVMNMWYFICHSRTEWLLTQTSIQHNRVQDSCCNT